MEKYKMKKIIVLLFIGFVLSNCSGVVKCNTTFKRVIHEGLVPICNSY